MRAEFLQFGIMLAGFCVVLLLWLRIVYLPRRTMERWRDPKREPRNAASGVSIHRECEAVDVRENS